MKRLPVQGLHTCRGWVARQSEPSRVDSYCIKAMVATSTLTQPDSFSRNFKTMPFEARGNSIPSLSSVLAREVDGCVAHDPPVNCTGARAQICLFSLSLSLVVIHFFWT